MAINLSPPWRPMVAAVPAIGNSPSIEFFPGDLELVRDNLDISVYQLELLAQEMNGLISHSIATVYKIQSELDKIETLKTSLYELRGSENYTLKSAGAITWEGDRAAGMMAEIEAAKLVILKALRVEHLVSPYASMNTQTSGFTVI
jgi:hypothetical protein